MICIFKPVQPLEEQEWEMPRVVAERPGNWLGRNSGKKRPRLKLRWCWGKEGASQCLMPACISSGSNRGVVCSSTYGFHGNSLAFPFQISDKCMKKDPGLGAFSSGKTSQVVKMRNHTINLHPSLLRNSRRDLKKLIKLAAQPGDPSSGFLSAPHCLRLHVSSHSISVVEHLISPSRKFSIKLAVVLSYFFRLNTWTVAQSRS